jgi:hypothetical protein
MRDEEFDGIDDYNNQQWDKINEEQKEMDGLGHLAFIELLDKGEQK